MGETTETSWKSGFAGLCVILAILFGGLIWGGDANSSTRERHPFRTTDYGNFRVVDMPAQDLRCVFYNGGSYDGGVWCEALDQLQTMSLQEYKDGGHGR